METVVHKYFILNSDLEVLVFIKNDDTPTLFLPRISNNEVTEFSFHKKLIKLFKDVGVDFTYTTFLKSSSTTSDREILRYVNKKKVYEKDKHTRKYYLTFADFDDETIRSINELCASYNILPYYVSVYELDRFATKDFQYEKKGLAQVECNVRDALKVLKIKLK
ncbi:MAG: hypothetical protein J1F35_02090 [Erysipelotrichales bacterium]|nr:hypothetical protein [Erysipelotrichales bacterium]